MSNSSLLLLVIFASTWSLSVGYACSHTKLLLRQTKPTTCIFTIRHICKVQKGIRSSVSDIDECNKTSLRNILVSLLVSSSFLSPSMVFTAPKCADATSLTDFLASSIKSSPSSIKDQYNIYNPPSTPEKGYQSKSGLRYFDLREGDIDISPKYGQLISFQYSGYYKSNKENSKLELFDSSYLHSTKTPFLQKHGNGRIIRGIDEGLHTMKVGGFRRIIVPKSIGYTDIGLGPLPDEPSNRRKLGGIIDLVEAGEGDMIFDLELLLVADDENDQGYYDDVAISQEEIRQMVVKTIESNRIKVIENTEEKGIGI